MRSAAAAFAIVAFLGACSSPQGDERQSCFPNGTCNAGLACLSNVCVRLPADGGTDAATDVPGDVAIDVPAPIDAIDATDVPNDLPASKDTGPSDVPTDTTPTDSGVDAGPIDSGPCMPCVPGTSLLDHCCLS